MPLLIATLGGCAKPDAAAPAPRPVDVIVVGSGNEANALELSGTIHARHEVPLAFRVGGKVIRRLIDVGSVVNAGQALALLDVSDLELQAARADAQRDLAEAEAKRFRQLLEANVVSRAAVDAREAALATASAQAALASNEVRYATLRSDSAGVITQVNIEPGQVVAAGTPSLTLARSGEREVAVSIPESSIANFTLGDLADIRLWANEDKIYHGRIRELSAAADPVTRTYSARLTLVDADDRVNLGMTARARFSGKQRPTLKIPLPAVFQQDTRTAVWVLDQDQRVVLRPVIISAYSDSGAMVASGLQPGERIVASGVHAVYAGEQVVIATSQRKDGL
jgi:RND family efflux transporter MFP subunit